MESPDETGKLLAILMASNLRASRGEETQVARSVVLFAASSLSRSLRLWLQAHRDARRALATKILKPSAVERLFPEAARVCQRLAPACI